MVLRHFSTHSLYLIVSVLFSLSPSVFPFVSLFFYLSSSSVSLLFFLLFSSCLLCSFIFSSALLFRLLFFSFICSSLLFASVVVVVLLSVEHASVCPFKTSLCVPAPRPHVQNLWTCCWYSMCVVVLLCLSLFFPHVCLHQINTCVKTGHNTCTCQVTQCVNELRTHP